MGHRAKLLWSEDHNRTHRENQKKGLLSSYLQ